MRRGTTLEGGGLFFCLLQDLGSRQDLADGKEEKTVLTAWTG